MATTFCCQPHKQASAQGYNNDSNNKAWLWLAAACEDKDAADLSSRLLLSYVIALILNRKCTDAVVQIRGQFMKLDNSFLYAKINVNSI